MPGPPPPPPPGPPPPPPGPSSTTSKGKSSGDGRNMLLQSIRQGTKLKKTVTVDKSGPMIPGKTKDTSNENFTPSGSSGGAPGGGMPGLGGLFAGGMPKLRSTGRGIGSSLNSNTSPKISTSKVDKPVFNESNNSPVNSVLKNQNSIRANTVSSNNSSKAPECRFSQNNPPAFNRSNSYWSGNGFDSEKQNKPSITRQASYNSNQINPNEERQDFSTLKKSLNSFFSNSTSSSVSSSGFTPPSNTSGEHSPEVAPKPSTVKPSVSFPPQNSLTGQRFSNTTPKPSPTRPPGLAPPPIPQNQCSQSPTNKPNVIRPSGLIPPPKPPSRRSPDLTHKSSFTQSSGVYPPSNPPSQRSPDPKYKPFSVQPSGLYPPAIPSNQSSPNLPQKPSLPTTPKPLINRPSAGPPPPPPRNNNSIKGISPIIPDESHKDKSPPFGYPILQSDLDKRFAENFKRTAQFPRPDAFSKITINNY